MQDFPPSLLLMPEPLRSLRKGAAWLGGAALLALGAAMAPMASAQTSSGSTTGIDASGNARSEMAACRSGKTAQNRATCMKEARNAQAARRTGGLQNYGDQFAANALKRCEVFKEPDDQTACRARVEQGRLDGSVAAGGILREAQTEVSVSPDMMQGTGTRADTGSGTTGSTGTGSTGTGSTGTGSTGTGSTGTGSTGTGSTGTGSTGTGSTGTGSTGTGSTGTGSTGTGSTGTGTGTGTHSGSGAMPMDTPPRPMPQQ